MRYVQLVWRLMLSRIRLLASLSLVLTSAAFAAEDVDAIRYTLRFPDVATHYMEVEASYPTRGARSIELMMPVWAPGSYLVREFARNVEEVRATNGSGAMVAVTKTRKNRWKFDTNGASRVGFRYRLYGREMRVQTNFIDSDFALINGAASFIVPAGQLASPLEVTIDLPRNWARSISSLPNIGGEANRYRAANYDELVDSPIVAGNPDVHDFSVQGTPHLFVDVGSEAMWDGAKAAADTAKIVDAHRAFWRSLPYERYIFFNLIVDVGGGLEHKGSTVLMARRFAMRTRKSYVNWLSLVSHEHLHAWNVKRLRPVELGPFDYENENYTTNLWISEGFTDYFGDLTLGRSGLITRKEYLDSLSEAIETLQTTPGRLVQPVASASYDAWIKAYRSDENTPNTAISYYTKGSVVAWVLDAKIRKGTRGLRSLDDVMRTAYERFSGTRGFTTDQFVAIVREIGDPNAAAWLSRTITSTAEIDYKDALDWFGLEFSKIEEKPDDEKPVKAWLGATTKEDNGRLIVTQVRRETPAFQYDINVDDEIIAIDDLRVAADQLSTRLEQYKPGDKASILISRRGTLRKLDVTFGTETPKQWNLKVVKEATPEQASHLAVWLGAGAAAAK